ncbi:MAG: bifunctional precorrin-2 dehydrogenase/sirohydrochlorin ferrochelatase [Desulfobacula sp.]|uniref:precorrin-2 dehydrogenase/sirohydrochlorin ferrochelatase family protein n=1 Tax=Desulfobacula sp. TaxID=2593537 RepID=UPI0025C4E755|nr:bifunctional precorrin-2 dehydrogenase/sirohydrochlorin ferrochelatase [Desulfobacula sp.]MCD4718723.1 bifunctional precorrin-2 dehydrogenase/sirohydrochlorin ferrochelatase [Desulfobacula sp.]
MKYYPIFLELKGKDCLVVGGGSVGARKAATLEKCGANVKVISDRFSPRFDDLKKTTICLEKKEYEKQDVKGMFLVFAATNNADLNQQIKNDASMLNILCNVADAPDNSDFLLPSIVDRGDLIVAVSTSGSSPAMAKKIRQDLENYFGPEYAQLLGLMGNIRKKLLSSGQASNENKAIFHTLIEKGILELIKANDEININAVLCDVLGRKYSYQDLVSSRSDE